MTKEINHDWYLHSPRVHRPFSGGSRSGPCGLHRWRHCAGSCRTGGTSAPASNDLRWFDYEGESLERFKEQIAKFDAQAGTTTTVDSLPGSGAAVYPDKLRTELLGGKGPDVWRIWGGQIGAPFVKAKQAMDLTPYYQKFGWDSRINTEAIEGMTFEGVKAGVPFTARGIGAWYNKALFEKAGITAEPASYAELEEANEKLLAAGTTPLGTGGKYGWHIMRLYEYLLETSAGPELHDKLLTGQESWDRPEVVTAFTNFKKWQDKKWIAEGAVSTQPTSSPSTCKARMRTRSLDNGPSRSKSRRPKGLRGLRCFPASDRPHAPETLRLRRGLHDQRKSGNPDKSAELIDFIVQPETQKALKVGSSAVAGAEPDPKESPLSYEWSQGPGSSRSTPSRTRRFRRR